MCSSDLSRPSAVAGAAAAAGAPAGAVIGIRHALERGRGTRAVPVGTALIGSVAGVAALCATAAAAGAPAGAVIGIRHALERGRGTRAVPVGTALIGSVAGVAALCATAAAAGAPAGAVIGIRHALERGRGTRAVPVGTALIGSVAGVAALCATAAAAGAPAGAVIGIRHALERGRGTRAVPVGTALIGSVAGVAALCATAVFGSSLAHLTATPALYGAPYQDFFNSSGPGAVGQDPLIKELVRDPAIGRITLVSLPAVTVNRVSIRVVTATVIRGPMLLSAADGRLPAGDDQIALGASTMRTVGARIGSLVRVTATASHGATRAGRFRVVGLLPIPTDFGTGGIGTGAAMTTAGYTALVCPPAPKQAQCRTAVAQSAELVLVRAAPGPAGAAALARHIARNQDNTTAPTVPAALVNFGASAAFPLLLGGVVAVCGLAALAHLLVVSVTRRRTETGLLRALGMVRRQLATIVLWQATTVAVIAIAAGIPLGIAAGRAIWRAFAISLGVVPVPVVQAWLIVALAAGALLAANVLAAVPAMSAARSRPGHLLRTE